MTGEQHLDFVTIVSGLPRSGTSMMMRMLEAGGMPMVVDYDRKPDEDNPNGYYEFEAVKKMKEDVSWMGGAVGKAVKAIHVLLYDLPKEFRYRVVFMRRGLNEVIASQNTMLQRSGASTGKMETQVLARHFDTQLKQVDSWLQRQPHMKVLYVDYAEAVRDPLTYAQRISEFLGGALDWERMAATVDSGLYRQRSSRPPGS